MNRFRSMVAWLGLAAATAVGQVEQGSVEDVLARIEAARLEASVRRLAAFGNRNALGPADDGTTGIGAAAAWLEAELTAAGDRLEVGRDRFEVAGHPMANVIATLPGTRRRLVVVGAHYDSRNEDPRDTAGPAPGANDDGSGTAAVLELARALADERFEATVLFAFFSGEEHGLHGSRHLAARLVGEGRSVVAVLSNDCVGNVSDPNGNVDRSTVRVFSAAADGLDSPSRQLARYVDRMAAAVDGIDVELVYRLDRFGRGGDHRPFHEAGFPAVRLCEKIENYERQHSAADRPEHLDYDYLARVARLDAVTILALARAPAAPAAAIVRGAGRHEVELVWEAVDDDDLDRYEILIRATSAPRWETIVPVGRQLLRTVLTDRRIDDAFFAVRAVDREGHASLATHAVPR